MPSNFTVQERFKAGNLAIQVIKERTSRGYDKYGMPFVEYSEAYRERKGSRLVDLQLSGAMLNNLQILGTGTGFVVIGYQANSVLNDRASYAKASDNGPVRDFLGLSEVERNQIINQIKADNLSSNFNSLINR